MNHDGVRVAIDAGGTHVRAAAFLGGVELRRATAGAANPVRVGPAEARAELTAALRDLVRHEPRAAAPVGACVGIAGRSHPETAAAVRGAFADAGLEIHGPRLLVTDAELVLWAAFGEAAPSGVAVVAGTGSIAMVRTADGGLVRAGGHGPILGDEGGGHWIGVQGLKVALRLLEEAAGGRRARPSALVDELHAFLGGGGLPGVPAAVARGEVRPSALAPVVVRAAERGDRDADEILRHAGAELAGLALRAATSAGLRGPFEVRGAGGVFAGAARVAAAVRHELSIHRPEAVFADAHVEPLVGADRLLERSAKARGDVPPGW
jgi:N-acetylglucosamine kinase-like BadF-type ATPase